MFLNNIDNKDCIIGMFEMDVNSVDFTLTDIPYNGVNQSFGVDWGLRKLDKSFADEITFNLKDFLDNVYKVTKSTICIFCSKEQFSEIYTYFSSKKGTTRVIIWEKTNPSPMNGQYVYLSGVEMACLLDQSEAASE